MKKCQKKSSIINASSFVLISLICLLVGCGGDESKLAGKWISESRGSHRDFPNNLELFKDGTGIFQEMSINWKLDNNRFIVTSSLRGFAYNYVVSDFTLILTNDNGISVEYEKANYMEQRIAERDKKKYKSVKIGNQIWMAENLNYNASGSKCYENDPVNCTKYGRLYNWETALEACPKDWHLPDDLEWYTLLETVGGGKTAYKHLKAKSGWNENGNGEDTYGFAALPGGYGNSFGSFSGISVSSVWWSASEFSGSLAYSRKITNSTEYDNSNKSSLLSVRCVKD